MTSITMGSISEDNLCDLDNQLNMELAEEESALLERNITYYHNGDLMKELENVKDELDKIKNEMAFILEEKTLAEKQIQASSSKVMSHASSMRMLRKETTEIREEKVLKELARIEAMKELEAIEAQGEEDLNQFLVDMENTKRKMYRKLKEIDRAKQMEAVLSETTNDISILQISLEMAKASEKSVRRSESMRRSGKSFQTSEMESIAEKLVLAKKELEKIQGEAVQFMASMDIIRKELICVCEEKARLEKSEKKTEVRVQNLNSKLLRANEKLGTVSTSEEKARVIVSNLTYDLVLLKTEIKASKNGKDLIREEIKNIEAVIQKAGSEIELGVGRLDDAILELELVKSSESRALEELKDSTESTMEARANISQQTSSITISKFEYEYLKERAVGADVVADKKVAAAQAWIEALKASEREICMKIEIEQRRNKEIEGKQEGNKTVSQTKSAMWTQSNNSTPLRRVRPRRSIMLAARNMSRSSITMRKKNGFTPSVTRDNQNVDTEP